MVAFAVPLLVFLAAGCPGSAYRTVSQLDLADGVLQKAKELLLQFPKLSLTDEEVAETLGKHTDLHHEVVNHKDGEKVSSALLERARSALSGIGKMDDAARRKETPCHCVLEKVEEVDMDEDLEVGAIGTYLNLDMDSFPVTADHGPANIKFVDLDKEKTFWSEGACHEGCFSYCKDDEKFILDGHELRELGITQPMNGNMVAAQCKGERCECLDMDRTKKYIRALKTVQKGGDIDVASRQIHNFPSEGDCLGECGGICEHIEEWLGEHDEEWDKQGDKEMDWEGVCFDEA